MKTISFLILFFLLQLQAFAQPTNGVVLLPNPFTTPATLNIRYALAVDKNDNVWAGYKFSGLGKYTNGSWTMYDSINNGLLSNTIYAIAVDDNNNIWAGTKNGLQKFDGTSFQSYTTANSGLIDNLVTTLFTKDNIVYIGTKSGVSIFDGNNWVSYSTANSGLVADSITAITVATNNDKYFGTFNGLSCLKTAGNWITYDSASVNIDNSIWGLIADTNSVYIGTGINSFVLSKNVVTSFETLFGCNEGIGFPTYSFAKTSTGRIYFGSNTSPLYELEKGVLKKYYLNPVLSNVEFAISSKDSLFIFIGLGNYLQGKIQKFEPGQYLEPLINNTTKYIDINDVNALILNAGMMHWDGSTDPKYFVPRCSRNVSVYASALWLGGLDASNQLHLAAQTYRQTGEDFWPGPIDTVTHVADTASSAFYNQIWKLDRNEIETFKYQFALGHVTNGTYSIPGDMLSWPAHGILNNANNLAPFIDFNHDGNYNPYDGDYPEIKGDQYLYWIFNDNLKAHTQSVNGLPLGVEIHASAYAYNCPQLNDSDAVMNLTTFYQYKIINRSGVNYHDMYGGLWCDVDLGKYSDDYVGCDTTLDIGFVYNGDNDDDGAGGYGLNPPMQNVLILKGPVAANADGKDNNHNGVIDETDETLGMTCFIPYFSANNVPTSNPQQSSDYYHYMKSEWLDGQHFTSGGNGYNPNNPPIDYLYPGTPFDSTQWNERNSGNTPEDRRFVMSSGPFNLNANDTATIDFAYVFTRDESAPNGLNTSIARNIKDVKKIIEWYKADNFPSCITKTFPPLPSVDTSSTLIIFPNPSNQILNFSLQLNSASPQYFIYDLLGQKIMSAVIKNKSININALSNGVYFLQIKDGEMWYQQKFLKLEKK